MTNKSKIFQIGFNKCATHSFHAFFSRNGIRSLHWESGQIALEIYRNLNTGQSPLGRYESDFQAFTDMEYHTGLIFAYRYFRELHRAYPGAFFILNTRNIDDWIRSRLKHENGAYAEFLGNVLQLGEADLIEFWRQEWHTHHDEVRQYFSDYERFLVYDINHDNPSDLCDFLSPEYACDAEHWGHHYKTVQSSNADEDGY